MPRSPCQTPLANPTLYLDRNSRLRVPQKQVCITDGDGPWVIAGSGKPLSPSGLSSSRYNWVPFPPPIEDPRRAGGDSPRNNVQCACDSLSGPKYMTINDARRNKVPRSPPGEEEEPGNVRRGWEPFPKGRIPTGIAYCKSVLMATIEGRKNDTSLSTTAYYRSELRLLPFLRIQKDGMRSHAAETAAPSRRGSDQTETR
jgi:hypothetical protein